MNSEVKKRKKRFWAFCLVFVLMMGNVMPMLALAKEYSPGDLTTVPAEVELGKVNIVNAGDTIVMPSLWCRVSYWEDGQFLGAEGVDSGSNYEIKSYTDVCGGSSEGKGWKVIGNSFNYSSGMYDLDLEEYNYTKSNINYVLDGGDNSATNPSIYYEGKEEITLEAATKECYTFEGWYSDPGFTTKVTAISKTQTGDITLYAKFTPNTYGITYELDGGTNGAGNPASYVYGTGVSGFADASKDGYAFGGWYKDAAFTTRVTSISTTQTGDVTLYAKFTRNDNDNTALINYEMLNGANSSWMHGSSENLTFRSAGDFSKFTGVKVDGNLVDSSNYSAEEGSTIITLKASYLNTLTIDTHTIEILSTDGFASTKFTVYADTSDNGGNNNNNINNNINNNDNPGSTSSDNSAVSDGTDKKDAPKTGDNTPIFWFFMLAGISGTVLIVSGKKKNLKTLRK